MDEFWAPQRARAWRVWGEALLIGTVGGALLGGVVWTAAILVSWSPMTPMLWLPGLVLAIPVGAAVGILAAGVAGGVLAVAQARSRDGLGRTRARGLAGPTAGLVALALALLDPGSPRYVFANVLPVAVVTAGLAVAFAPGLVAPRWRVVHAGRHDAATPVGRA